MTIHYVPEYMAVVPSGAWTNQESQNRRGRPATHLVQIVDGASSETTLCRRNPDGWMISELRNPVHSGAYLLRLYGTGLCYQCRQVLEKQLRLTPPTGAQTGQIGMKF